MARFGLVEKLVNEIVAAKKKAQALFITWTEDKDLEQLRKDQEQFGRQQVDIGVATDDRNRRHRKLLYRELVRLIAKHRSDQWTEICDEIEDYIETRPLDWNGSNLILTKAYSTMTYQQINKIRETIVRHTRKGTIYRRTLQQDPETKKWHWID